MSDSVNSDARTLEVGFVKRILNYLGIYAVILLILPLLLIWDSSFLNVSNIGSMLVGIQHLLVVIIGASFITYSGKMADLSIPSTMAMAGFVSISLLPMGFLPALLAGIFSGAVIGLINGWGIGYLKLNPIIWTLAMNFILRGLLQWYFSGTQIYPPENTTGDLYLMIASTRVLGFIPVPILCAILLFFIFHYLMRYSKFGRTVRLIGSSEKVAQTTGVNVSKILIIVFILSSICTALGGISLCSSARNATFDSGLGYDFSAVTAIVLGGISLQGGKGFLSGAIGGLILIAIIENVLSSIPGMSIYWQEMIKAVIFISVVAINTRISTKVGKV